MAGPSKLPGPVPVARGRGRPRLDGETDAGDSPARKIRIPDSLWLPAGELAGRRGIPTSLLVRQLLEREIEDDLKLQLSRAIGQAPKRSKR